MSRILLFILCVLFYSEFKTQDLLVQSTAFANTHYIPYRYSCEAENVNPGLRVTNVPKEAKSLVLIMIDTSAAFGVFDHWIVWNIPVSGKINENSVTGVTGRNGYKQNKYSGPCPPNGIHEYHFRVYALNTELNLPDSSGKERLMKAMVGHVLSKGEVIGLFQRQ